MLAKFKFDESDFPWAWKSTMHVTEWQSKNISLRVLNGVPETWTPSYLGMSLTAWAHISRVHPDFPSISFLFVQVAKKIDFSTHRDKIRFKPPCFSAHCYLLQLGLNLVSVFPLPVSIPESRLQVNLKSSVADCRPRATYAEHFEGILERSLEFIRRWKHSCF